MFFFLLQTRELLLFGNIHFFWTFFVFVWAVWAVKATVAGFYQPTPSSESASRLTGSAVIPVVDEPLEVFEEVLARVSASEIEQIIVVINGRRNPGIEQVCKKFPGRVEWVHTPTPGKRNAVALGVRRSRGDLVALVDSDTIWQPDTWVELRAAFGSAKVGGATTHQRIFNPGRHWLTRYADWLEDIRCRTSMPAMSVLGQVGCLPGRTIAFRRHLLNRFMDDFLNDVYLGTHLEISDDRALTNYTLRAGYRTVYQRTSVVYTDAPTNLRTFVKQQYRWSKGSQYNTLRMVPWMLRKTPLLLLCFAADVIIPFFLFAVVFTMIVDTILYHPPLFDAPPAAILWGEALVGALVGTVIRQWAHLWHAPLDLVFLPVFLCLLFLLMPPIRLIGFFRAAFDEGWGTRADAYVGGARRSLLRFVPICLGILMTTFFCLIGLMLEQPQASLRILTSPSGQSFLVAVAELLVATTVGLVYGRSRVPAPQPPHARAEFALEAR
ncbi:glycosyltransferase [Streptomyces sp. NPDC056707]|uniref:glycosyltransferase n=1 Tax=Streptomyces sp. NPDC056707 TaxID=3345919 RepID=UPI0036B963D8